MLSGALLDPNICPRSFFYFRRAEMLKDLDEAGQKVFEDGDLRTRLRGGSLLSFVRRFELRCPLGTFNSALETP